MIPVAGWKSNSKTSLLVLAISTCWARPYTCISCPHGHPVCRKVAHQELFLRPRQSHAHSNVGMEMDLRRCTCATLLRAENAPNQAYAQPGTETMYQFSILECRFAAYFGERLQFALVATSYFKYGTPINSKIKWNNCCHRVVWKLGKGRQW